MMFLLRALVSCDTYTVKWAHYHCTNRNTHVYAQTKTCPCNHHSFNTIESSSVLALFSITIAKPCCWVDRCADDQPFVPTYQVSKEKTKSLGIDYIPLKTSLKETVESLKEKGFVNFWWGNQQMHLKNQGFILTHWICLCVKFQ